MKLLLVLLLSLGLSSSASRIPVEDYNSESTDSEENSFTTTRILLDSQQINPENCGLRNNETSSLRKRFLSSTRSNQRDFGWLVLLSCPNGVMSGNLINSQWVLTRARFSQQVVRAKVGAPIELQIRNITQVFAHHDYDPETGANDIALIKLDKPVEYSPLIVPICLPSAERIEYIGVEASHASFMVNPETLSLNSNELRKSDRLLMTMSDTTCENRLNTDPMKFNSTIQMCTLHDVSSAVFDSQGVDNGAALTVREGEKWYAVGIANSNWVFEDKADYTVFSRVSIYVDWIKETIENN